MLDNSFCRGGPMCPLGLYSRARRTDARVRPYKSRAHFSIYSTNAGRCGILSVLLLSVILTACQSETHYAPVTDISTIERIPQSGFYLVAPGETLYSIAWRYGLDYRYLASINHIAPPFHVVAGQRIDLHAKATPTIKSAPATMVSTRHLPAKITAAPPASTHYVIEHEVFKPVNRWNWPAHGRVINSYSYLNKGINIAGRRGDPIYATAAGQVVYSGSGLRGYGKLLIIKHNSTYLSAYAHNSVILVREGQHVKADQEIAKMGDSGARRIMLHFEIRRNGQPVNPLRYLQR